MVVSTGPASAPSPRSASPARPCRRIGRPQRTRRARTGSGRPVRVPEAVLIERSGLPGAQRRAPDPARPVPLLHGLGGTKSSWSFLARTLRARGLTVDAITYSPFGTSIEQLADRLSAQVA